jgi:hypothetical protein
MSYSNGEALILALVQTATNFSSTNATRGDWTPLNKGKAACYAILKPGATNIKWATPTLYWATHQTVIQIWRQYTKDGTTLTNLEADVANILSVMEVTRRMKDTTGNVRDAKVIGMREVQEQWKKGGGPAWLSQEIVMEWVEEVEVVYDTTPILIEDSNYLLANI